jgi:hypothetical protein
LIALPAADVRINAHVSLRGRVASQSTADNGDRRDGGMTSERNALLRQMVMPYRTWKHGRWSIGMRPYQGGDLRLHAHFFANGHAATER